ncbi:Zn-dependent hydrolase [Microbaculum marinisediminis]|uniref:Zn-dependent hydrolase n=1 Tax=Microbaculum marinisediminis TaxID=2931392 RepID=A0AAW5R696_9HYPH|nr:Zn-dependent hydrolase [Microbaculum sp. A6E488]MCT8974206.1 Zn-dependent hydrolase [Microbaculum sp. A6E488]
MSKSAIDALAIDLDRLESDIEAVNGIGRVAGQPGINRVSFSDADMAGRRWLMGRMEEAGLEARMDAVGNVFGRWNCGSGPVVMAGSHLDTVPQGGPLDGTLGVCAALEAVRAMKGAGIAPARPVEVVCTADEEGRFGGMLGSQAICGEVGPDWIARAVDDSGLRLAEAMRMQGLDPEAAVARDASDIAVFLELHIEQGPVLARAGVPIGIVDAISGVFNWTVTLTGEANHSGTTPMDGRRDAFRGLADFGAAIPAILAHVGGPDTRLTVGKVALDPNFPHSIAGAAVFSVIGRDVDEAVMRDLAGACRAEILEAADRNGLGSDIAEQSWLPPTRLHDEVAGRLIEIARRSGLEARMMASGAGHDVQTFAHHCPAGLIFVPSIGGISHAPAEWTDWADIERGANVLTRAIAAFAT